MRLNRPFQNLHVSIEASLHQIFILNQVICLKQFVRREVASVHLDWNQVSQDALLVLNVVLRAQLEGFFQFQFRHLKVRAVHMIAPLVIRDVDSPRLGEHLQLDAFTSIVLKPLEEPLATLEVVQGELHLDDVQHEEVRGELPVVGWWVRALHQATEESLH